MNEFVDHVLELMESWAPVRARRMFGGHGLYREGRMFALVFDDTLYMKAGPATRHRFAAASSTPFVYESGGRSIEMSYWRAPDECLDDRASMCAWCALAWEAAWRAPSPARRASRKATTTRPGPQCPPTAQARGNARTGATARKAAARKRPRR